MKKSLFFQVLLMANLCLCMSCSDDDSVNEFDSVNTLNMLNAEHGRTLLGESDVFITEENNFQGISFSLVVLGSSKGLGKVVDPKLNKERMRKLAVLPGNRYQIFDEDQILKFPSGKSAMQLGSFYYQIYVASEIQKEGENIGAVVKFAPIYPQASELPANESETIEMYIWDTFELTLPSKDGEILLDSEAQNQIIIEETEDKNRVLLYYYERQGKGQIRTLYMREGNLYTKINLKLN